ncbi:DNA repair protein rhp54 [Hordeum vulgare]|nr:DNA repair protein rhp54 [Hordeum vulgare]
MIKLACSPAFMQDEVDLDLDGCALDHVFSDDYDLEEEDEVDINGDLCSRTSSPTKPLGCSQKSRRTKAYTTAEDKLLCECWRNIWQDPKVDAEQKASTFWIRVHREFHKRKKFPLYQMQSTSRGCPFRSDGRHFKPWRHSRSNTKTRSSTFLIIEGIIKDEDKFKVQYAALTAHEGKEAVEEVGEGEKPRLRGKTNSKKMLEIEAANAKTKAKEVALASMMTGWRS